MAKEKRITMPFDNLKQGKETEASKAGKTQKGDTKKSMPKDNKKISAKNTKTKGKETSINMNSNTTEKKKPTFVKGGKTVKKKK